jgi:hypothetical protein
MSQRRLSRFVKPAGRSFGRFRAGRLPIWIVALLVAFTGGISAVAIAGPASAAGDKGQIYVIHGIVGQTLDVYVDGKKVLPEVKPKTIVGPLSLAPGVHQVSLRRAGTSVASSRFSVGAGQSLDVVAHLRADNSTSATVTAFRNDLSVVGPGKLRLAVAHVAAAPPADIRVNGDVLFSNVASGETLTVVVPPKTYTVDIVPAATSGQAILGPVSLTLRAGTLTKVYAIGNVRTGSMDAIVHTLPVRVSGAAVPRSVPTGDGGQAATEFVTDHSRVPELMLASALVLLLAAGLIALAGRRLHHRPSW